LIRLSTLGALVAAAGLAASTTASAQGDPSIHGVWRNPKNSVHVEIKPCPAGACGYVVWATDKAKQDAREGGTANLVGLQLLRDFSQDKKGVWRGKVFVPDLNRTFTGVAELSSPTTLKAKGCFVVLCKSQTWTRINAAAD
jgi:uncharacterized protein (DUF2147 family)